MFHTIISFIKNHSTLMISLISLFLSLYNFIYSLVIRHKKIKVDILKYRKIHLKGNIFYQFQFIITNKSQLPISINNISIGNTFCKFDPTRITDKELTTKFPISLSSLESNSGWLEFKSKNELDLNSIKFNIYTSRGLCKRVLANTINMVNDHPNRCEN